MMKNTKIFLLAIMGVFAISSCGSGYYASTLIQDDIYYRPSKSKRAEAVNKQEEIQKARTKHYTLNDDSGHSYSFETDMSYEQLLRRFDNPYYDFDYNYGRWYDPWYNPWWGINRWHSPFYYGSWYSWYSPYSYSFYNPFYYDNYLVFNWYSPWDVRWGLDFGLYYDPWYWNYSYGYPYHYTSALVHHYNPGINPKPVNTYYGQRTGNNGSLMSPSRQEAMRGISPSSSETYSNRGVYTGRSVNTGRGVSTTEYRRGGGNYSTGGTRSANTSSTPSYSSHESSSGSSYSRSSGGYSSSPSSSGSFSGSTSGGNAGGSGTHSGGGRR